MEETALLTSKDTTRTKIFLKKFNLKFDKICTPHLIYQVSQIHFN